MGPAHPEDLPAWHDLPPLGLGVDIGGSEVGLGGMSRLSSGELVPRYVIHTVGSSQGPVGLILDVLEFLTGADPEVFETTCVMGVAAPGFKTDDGRGIARARNREPEPTFLDDLEEALGAAGFDRLRVGPRLHSDAAAALVGEGVVEEGFLRGEEDVLFLQPGTGLAEALLVGGEVRPIEGPRAWELPPTVAAQDYGDLEHQVSLRRMLERLDLVVAAEGSELGDFEGAVERGNVDACLALSRMAEGLAQLVEQRAECLAELCASSPQGSPAVALRTSHGRLFSAPAVRRIVLPPVREAAERHGARLLVPEAQVEQGAACAGALELTLRDLQEPRP